MYISVEHTAMVTRVYVLFSYVKHVPISCVLLIYGYVMLGTSHGGQYNKQMKAWTHTDFVLNNHCVKEMPAHICG